METDAARQLAGIEQVSRRASAMSRRVAALVVIPCTLLVFPAYLVFRQLQFALVGINFTYVSGALAMLVTLGPGIPLARVLSRLAVRARRRAWIEQAASEHGIPVQKIADFTSDWH